MLARDSCAPLQVLPAALALAKSPLLQGSALEALQAFFSALPACEPAGVSSDSLLASLLRAGQAKVLSLTAFCVLAVDMLLKGIHLGWHQWQRDQLDT